MSTTYVDTDLLEQMREQMYRALSKVEESAAVLRSMYNQMMTEDLGLSYYPQWEQAMEECSRVKQRTEAMADSLERFLHVLEHASRKYIQVEEEHVRLIEQLSSHMSILQYGMAGVMASDYPVGLAEGQSGSNAMELEHQVAMGVTSLEIANLMAITQVLQDEFSVSEVIPGMSVEHPDGEEDGKKERKTSSKADPQKGEAESEAQSDEEDAAT